MTINNLKFAFLLIAMALCLQAEAQLVFKTAFISQSPTPECYKVYITVLQQTPEFQMTFASEAEARHPKGDCQADKNTISLGTKPNCTASLMNGINFTTGRDAPKCFQEYVRDAASKAALQASIDFCLGHLKGFKGMKTSVVQGLLAYPIPAHNYLNIATGFKNIFDAMMTITDVAGKKVFQMQLQNPGSEAFTLCLKDFKPGYYFLTIAANGNELAKQTIIVQ